jgi:probable blue pigment (indigoidine) exporter
VLWFAALRALLAGAALLVAALCTPGLSRARLLPRGGATWALVGVLALMNVTVAFGAMVASTTGTSTGVASVLANAQALLVVLPAWWLFGERTRPGELAGVALGFGGLVLVAAPSGAGQGAGLALLAAVGITAGALLARLLEDVDVLTLGAWQFLLGGAALAGAAVFVEGAPDISLTWRFVGALGALAVAATALPYVLWFVELRRSSLTAVTAWTLLVPVAGVVLGVVVLGEGITLLEGIGDAILVVALALVANSGRTAARKRTAADSAARPGSAAVAERER